MLLLYSDRPGKRWQYVAEILLNDIGGIALAFTGNKEEFRSFEGPKINYSASSIAEQEVWIKPVSILFEEGIKTQDITVFEFNGYKAFFAVDEGDFPFDIFSASFYLLSRYEEYLPHTKDEYGRYAHTNSLAYKEDFLSQPLVNTWLEHLKRHLKQKFPTLIWRLPKFRFLPTYDIDVAYSYLNKGLARNVGGILKSLIKGEISALGERVKVLSGKSDDPYDVYEWLYALHLKYGLKPYYFFLVAKEQKGLDKNIEPTREEMLELIRYHAVGYVVGVHPSWQSGDDDELLREEIDFLEFVTNKQITNSRQHYIRFDLPNTFRRLIDAGIEYEFSMGYGAINGFRASVASPYPWYDLKAEEKTKLILFPFCFMDANSLYEQKYTPQQAFEEIKYYHDVVKKVNGMMITIWHNQFFSNIKPFVGWRDVYELFIKEVVYWDL